MTHPVLIGGPAEAETKRSPRELARLLRDALALVWRAAPREFLLAASLQVLAGVGAAVQLVIAKQVLDDLLAADRVGGDFDDAIPAAVLFVAVTLAITAAGVIQREYQRLLAELTRREAQNRILDVATAVELGGFEKPSFLGRLQRLQPNS